MKKLTDTPSGLQVIEKDGEPEYAVLPYREYLALVAGEATTPHAVVERHITGDVSLIKAWREHKGLTQKEVAAKLGMTQAAIAQIEKNGSRPHKGTLARIASALEIKPELLME